MMLNFYLSVIFAFLSYTQDTSASEKVAFFDEFSDFVLVDLPEDSRPIVPIERSFQFKGYQSSFYSVAVLVNLDLKFLKKIDGGIPKVIDLAKMMSLMSNALNELPMTYDNEIEMDTYAQKAIVHHLQKRNLLLSKKFMINLERIDPEKKCLNDITLPELANFIDRQKKEIFTKRSFINPFMPILSQSKCFVFEGETTNQITYHKLMQITPEFFKVLFVEEQWLRAFGSLRTLIMVREAVLSDEGADEIRKMPQAGRSGKANFEIYEYLCHLDNSAKRRIHFDENMKKCLEQGDIMACKNLLTENELINFAMELKIDILKLIPKIPFISEEDEAKLIKMAANEVMTWKCL